MNRFLCIAVVCAMVAPVLATPNLFEDFENGVGGDIVWTPYGGISGDPTTPVGSNNLLTTATGEHSRSGTKSARTWAGEAPWNGYTDFGSTSEFVRAEVYVYEDNSYTGDQPVTNMLCLLGDNGTNKAGTGADYLQIGVVDFWPGDNTTYGSRTKAGDTYGVSNISRKSGWTKLAIEADALADGGQVRYYVDDVLLSTGQRTATNLRWVRIGNNSKSYETFWYDDLSVTPEPASALLLLLGLPLLRRKVG